VTNRQGGKLKGRENGGLGEERWISLNFTSLKTSRCRDELRQIVWAKKKESMRPGLHSQLLGPGKRLTSRSTERKVGGGEIGGPDK